MGHPGVELRKGTAADMPEVFRLIRELAVFEREPEAVKLAVTDLEQHFHEGRFEVILAVTDKVVAGMALYYDRYSTWNGPCIHLEDLIVNEDFRGRGIGRMLLEAVVLVASSRGARKMSWEVLDWNTDAVTFYRDLGAQIETEWWLCRLDYSTLSDFQYRYRDHIDINLL